MWKAILLGAILTLSAAAAARAMDVDDVIGMLQAGIGEDVILKALDASEDTLFLTSEDLVDLKDAGASDWFLDELLSREEQPSSYPTRSYGSYYYPMPGYYSIGLVYDPFDYYFACYPYYYAYLAPLSFSWNWWYYGGPYHGSWCEPYHGYRVSYYASRWGTRSIWDRGFQSVRYHVPSYSPIGKDGSDVAYRRSGVQGNRTITREVWQRTPPGRRPADSGTWRRDRRDPRQPAQPPVRREMRSPARERQDRSMPPSRGSRPDVRREQPSRPNPPARGNRAAPSAPQRRAWSR